MVRLEGMDVVQKRFKKMRERMKDPNTGLELVAMAGWKNVIKHFNDTMGPDGEWDKLKTPRSRKRDKGSQKVLNDTGRLRMSNRWRVEDNTAEVFNQTHYAKYHQNGTSKMVARPFMYLDNKAIDTIVKIFKKHLFT